MRILYNNQFEVYLPEKYANSVSRASSLNIKKRIETGFWEKEEISILRKYLKESDSVLELGACLGILSIVTHNLLGKNSKHTVVEANPELISVIEQNRNINKCEFTIINCMVGDPSKNNGDFIISDFVLGSTQYSKGNKIKVPVIPLSSLQGHNFLIMDIEGGEYSLIDDNIQDISLNFNKLLIEFHTQYGFSNNYLKKSIDVLTRHGFKQVQNIGKTFYFEK